MPKYQYLFTFAGAAAARLARRKAIALGGDAKAYSAHGARTVGISVPEMADNVDAPPDYVVVAGELPEPAPPADLPEPTSDDRGPQTPPVSG